MSRHTSSTSTLDLDATSTRRRKCRRGSAPPRRRIPAVVARLEDRVLMATSPTVAAIVRAVPLSQFTSASSVSYAVTFDRAVTGVDSTDFRLTTSNGGLQAPAPVVVTGAGTTYTVQVNG